MTKPKSDLEYTIECFGCALFLLLFGATVSAIILSAGAALWMVSQAWSLAFG